MECSARVRGPETWQVDNGKEDSEDRLKALVPIERGHSNGLTKKVKHGGDHCADKESVESSHTQPNGMRLSCGAVFGCSQIEDYHSKTAPPASGAC